MSAEQPAGNTDPTGPATSGELGEATVFPSQPFLAMMLEPRKTLRAILASDTPRRYFWWLLALGTFAGVLQSALDPSLQSGATAAGEGGSGWQALAILMVGSVVAIPLAWIIIHLIAFLYRLVGGWLGGTGSLNNIATGMVWAQVPSILGLGLSLVLLVIYGPSVLVDPSQLGQAALWQNLAYVAIVFLQTVFGVWALVLSVANLSAAHDYGIGKALLTVLLVILLLGAIAIAVGAVLYGG
ncbi:YIP1 family protein [Ferrimonas marina]|uniref:Yip1 domain-containing protein n=1 Tax=Ferrimonas marina TaxID=299255 RepID=A0A1M5X8G4_9GAMM|nr:YIP1 family protein [Ferrimonas marina]SHH96066.1 Yip1 domain-containing protein [Ferrimonas marina]